MSTAEKPNKFVGLDQTRAPVDYEGGRHDPGTCPYCGGDPRHPRAIGGDGERQFICSARFHEICNLPPEGWHCTRERGHEGPCAARPDDESFFRFLWEATVWRFGKTGAWALVVIQVTVIVQFISLLVFITTS